MSDNGHALHRKRFIDWLEGLKWDRVPRMLTWLAVYLGADQQDPVRLASTGTNFLRSAIARVVWPGCRVDQMLVLHGAPAIGKSSALRVLAGEEFYARLSAPVDSKDACLALEGKWIVEVPNLALADPMNGLKGFLAQQYDEYRPPFEQRVQSVPRSCVLVGTTDHDLDLDETTSRRFWLVRCGRIRLDDLAHARNQLWAEALNSFAWGTPWWDVAEQQAGADHGR